MCKLKISDTDKLKYDVNIAMQIQCMCDAQRIRYKESCYFYHEERDMCATIPTCNYYSQLGYCPCKECNKYISKAEVREMVRKIVDERGE